jgi:hypothetical protein
VYLRSIWLKLESNMRQVLLNAFSKTTKQNETTGLSYKVLGVCCIFKDLISTSRQRQHIRLYMSLIELGLELMKEKQPINFGHAKSL